jgi:superfamily II DNA or RNA helicase
MTEVQLRFDRGTVVVDGVPESPAISEIHGLLWDPRVGAYRAPARLFYGLAAELRRRGVLTSDARPLPKLAPPVGLRTPELRPYQEAAVTAWRMGGRRGVVVLPTGSGKTHVAIAAMAGTRTPALCLVPTKALLAQWSAALAEHYGGAVGCFGDGEHRASSITVATFASAYRNMAVLGDHFGLLIVDEVHHFGGGGGMFDDALEMSMAPLRLGLTATQPPPGAGHDRIATLVGGVVFELGIDDLAGGYLAPLQRLVLRLRLDADERLQYESLAAVYRRAARIFSGNHLDAGWKDFVREASRTDEGRIGLLAWRQAARLLAFPRCKQRALEVLLERHHGQKILIFVANNETAYAVARQHLIMPLTCDIGRPERIEVLARFRAGELRALVSAQVLNEGLDVPDAEVAIVLGGRLGQREHVQRVGRILRPKAGKQALLYELVIERSGEIGQAARRAEGLASRRRSAA